MLKIHIIVFCFFLVFDFSYLNTVSFVLYERVQLVVFCKVYGMQYHAVLCSSLYKYELSIYSYLHMINAMCL